MTVKQSSIQSGDTKPAGFSLKDQLFNRERVEYLAGLLRASDQRFNRSGFVRDTMKRLTSLELKERIVHIAEQLECHLASDFREAAKQITRSLPPPLDPSKTDDDFGDFIFAPFGEFVVRNGIQRKHLRLSLRTLKELTQRFSMEDAIRAFINAHPDVTLTELDKWSKHSNYHVRRLVSEGSRPKLPWSKRLEIDVDVAIPFLDTLHADPTRYVTRSVSNHLNDIAKSNPDLVLRTLRRWQQAGKQCDSEFQWMCRHSLRTLVKQGNAEALSFLGYRSDPKIQVTEFSVLPRQVKPGDAIELSFAVSALRSESLMVDYVIDFVKANGAHSPKVHKLKKLDMKKGETRKIHKRHVLRANATTFKLYAGTHHVTLQINGKPFGTGSFELL